MGFLTSKCWVLPATWAWRRSRCADRIGQLTAHVDPHPSYLGVVVRLLWADSSQASESLYIFCDWTTRGVWFPSTYWQNKWISILELHLEFHVFISKPLQTRKTRFLNQAMNHLFTRQYFICKLINIWKKNSLKKKKKFTQFKQIKHTVSYIHKYWITQLYFTIWIAFTHIFDHQGSFLEFLED